jgi:hypothetical protein
VAVVEDDEDDEEDDDFAPSPLDAPSPLELDDLEPSDEPDEPDDSRGEPDDEEDDLAGARLSFL